jgi:hemerythrin-like domain-containing protein
MFWFCSWWPNIVVTTGLVAGTKSCVAVAVDGPHMQGPSAPRLRMHRPTDNLRADHVLTAQGLAVLLGIGSHVRAGGSFPAADCAMALRFLREFVLAVHLRKEIELVCPAVAMRGDDRAAELVGELMRLHEEVGELTHSLILFWVPVDDLTTEERAVFADTCEAVTARLARMQQLEEAQLFPACDASIPADDQLDWIDRFGQLEQERGTRSIWAQRLAPLLPQWRIGSQ